MKLLAAGFALLLFQPAAGQARKFLVVTRRAGAWGVSWGQNTRLADTVPDSECFTELRKAGAGA